MKEGDNAELKQPAEKTIQPGGGDAVKGQKRGTTAVAATVVRKKSAQSERFPSL